MGWASNDWTPFATSRRGQRDSDCSDIQEATVLKVENLSFAYGDQQVLRGVDLTVEEGEMVGLVGPNGSGKSTLLRLISGVLHPQGGRILLQKQQVADLRPSETAQRVAVVPQSPFLPPDFTAFDLVLMGRTPHLRLLQWEGQRDVESVRRAMQDTETWDLASRPLATLSGGERQRVLIARALAQEAPLLLLDEPTASLDLAHQTGVLDLVEQLQSASSRRPGAVLMAIHDLSLAAQYCRRMLLLHQGRIVAQGTPHQVLTQDTVQNVYGTSISITSHPVRGTPVVLPVAGDGRQNTS